MTKPRLTHDEHADLGRALAGIRDELNRRVAQLGNAYPQTGPESKPRQKVAEAVRAIDEARNALDSALFREHPETADPAIYWPAPEERSVVQPRREQP